MHFNIIIKYTWGADKSLLSKLFDGWVAPLTEPLIWFTRNDTIQANYRIDVSITGLYYKAASYNQIGATPISTWFNQHFRTVGISSPSVQSSTKWNIVQYVVTTARYKGRCVSVTLISATRDRKPKKGFSLFFFFFILSLLGNVTRDRKTQDFFFFLSLLFLDTSRKTKFPFLSIYTDRGLDASALYLF